MLTKKQKILFEYLDKYIDGSGISPSFEEMKQALGLKSKSGIHRLITSLEERGYIRRIKHKARAMEIVKNQKERTTKCASALCQCGGRHQHAHPAAFPIFESWDGSYLYRGGARSVGGFSQIASKSNP